VIDALNRHRQALLQFAAHLEVEFPQWGDEPPEAAKQAWFEADVEVLYPKFCLHVDLGWFVTADHVLPTGDEVRIVLWAEIGSKRYLEEAEAWWELRSGQPRSSK